MSPQGNCHNCDRPLADLANRLCATCLSGLVEQLLGVEGLLDDLLVAFAKQDHLGGELGGHKGKLTEAPLPLRLDITGVVEAVSNEITTWARDVAEFYGLDVPNGQRRRPHTTARPQIPDADAATLARGEFGRGRGSVVFPASSELVDGAGHAARWLGQHPEHLREHPAALELYQALTGAVARARAAIDRPPAVLWVGNCDVCSTGLYAERGAGTTRCERCRAWYFDVADRWDRALRRLKGYPVTAAQFSSYVGELYGFTIDRKRINLWHHRGDIRRVDLDPETGNPRFRVGELLGRAARYRKRRAV
ncbi:MAG: hypothetical protein JO296_21320 [Pseudonocardiales bacterium]|nr:hypothetical protein [Pseudonocardiales bacterium]